MDVFFNLKKINNINLIFGVNYFFNLIKFNKLEKNEYRKNNIFTHARAI